MNTQNSALSWVKERRNIIIYWIATLWLALGMLSTGLVQLLQNQAEIDFMMEAGYPLYFLTILGVGKVLGIIVVLAPKLPVLKEWAYAGLAYIVAGAAYTYISLGRFDDLYHLVLLAVLIAVSWYFRPASRRVSVK